MGILETSSLKTMTFWSSNSAVTTVIICETLNASTSIEYDKLIKGKRLSGGRSIRTSGTRCVKWNGAMENSNLSLPDGGKGTSSKKWTINLSIGTVKHTFDFGLDKSVNEDPAEAEEEDKVKALDDVAAFDDTVKEDGTVCVVEVAEIVDITVAALLLRSVVEEVDAAAVVDVCDDVLVCKVNNVCKDLKTDSYTWKNGYLPVNTKHFGTRRIVELMVDK